MINKLPYLTLAALVLVAFTAKSDDYAWGATTGSSMIEVDATATTATLVGIPYSGTTYYSFKLLAAPTGTLNNKPNNVALGASLWLAENSNGTLYGLDNNGNLYSITTTLSTDQNGDIGFVATNLNVSLGVNVTGAVWITSNLLDISSSQNLYQYNLAKNSLSNLGSLNSITGIAYNGSLYGVQFSPSPGEINYISGVNLTPLAGSSIGGLSQGSAGFAGASLLYVSDGNSGFYSYSSGTGKLNTITNALGSGIHSLTPLTVSGGGGTPTPSPTPTSTPTPTPTATPTPSATPIVYNVPIIGGASSLNVLAPETTPTAFPGPSSYPKCAPGYSYTSTPTASFAAGAKIDPAGILGVYRYYQTTTDGVNYSPTTATAAIPLSTTWPWTSGTTNTHSAISYTAGQVNNTTVPLDLFYGREILTLVYTLGNGTTTVLDTKTIYLYPWNYNSSQTISPTVLFTNAVTSVQAVSNPSPYAVPSPTPLVFQGDPPRFTVLMNDLYPNGSTSVIIYPGTPSSNPTATGSATISITAVATPNTGLDTTATPITFEVQSYINTSVTAAQTYTIAAIQTLPSSYVASTTNPTILNTLTFTTSSGFNVNGTVGTVK
jgi:hypothetical protein